MATQIQMRRDTAANWSSANPILATGEIGFDTTNNEIRIGDGASNWAGLSAIGTGGGYAVNYVTGDGINGIGNPIVLDVTGYSTSVFTLAAGSFLNGVSNLADGQKHIVVVPTLANPDITGPGAAQSLGGNIFFGSIEGSFQNPYDGTYGGTPGDFYPNANTVLVMELVGYNGSAYCSSWSVTNT